MEVEELANEKFNLIKLIGIGEENGKSFLYPIAINLQETQIQMVQGTSDGFSILYLRGSCIKIALSFIDLLDLLKAKGYDIHEDFKYLYDYYKNEFFKNLDNGENQTT